MMGDFIFWFEKCFYRIGTDATIAEHIKKIQERNYARKNNENRFIPTKIGLALAEGYNSMGYELLKVR